jgi:hypothetical protein
VNALRARLSKLFSCMVRNLMVDNFGYEYRNNNLQELKMKELAAEGK